MSWRPAAIVFALALAAPAARADVAPASAFLEANSAYSQHSDGFHLDDTPGSPALLERQWEALRRIAGGWLDQHPGGRPAALEAELKGLKPQHMDAHALRLDQRSWLVAANVDEVGVVFVLADKGKGFRTAWTIEQPRTWASGQSGRLLAWSLENARGSCRSRAPDARWQECGPLSGLIGRLPDDASGARRFYVDANYAQEAGATIGAQLSVWTWNGSSARPDFSHAFSFMADQPWVVRVRGEFLEVRAKQEFRHMFACGGCEGRQVVTSFRVSPTGVRGVGGHSLTPELDLLDKAYDRIALHQPTGDVAAPAVAAFIARQLKHADESFEPKTPAERTVGMIENWKATRRDGGKDVCLETDEGGAAVFRIAPSGAGERIVSAKSLPSGACGGAGARS